MWKIERVWSATGAGIHHTSARSPVSTVSPRLKDHLFGNLNRIRRRSMTCRRVRKQEFAKGPHLIVERSSDVGQIDTLRYQILSRHAAMLTRISAVTCSESHMDLDIQKRGLRRVVKGRL